MNEVEEYLQNVMRNIQAPPRKRAEIEEDLRAHIQEAIEAGESPSAVLLHMGNPQEVAAEFMAAIELHYASFWQRLGAYLIDIVLCLVVIVSVVGFAVAMGNLVTLEIQNVDYAIRMVVVLLAITLGIGGFAFDLLYFPILEGRFGQTVGKHFLGMRVVKDNGTPIGYKESFLRRIPFYFRFGFIDALFIFFTAKRQRAFDIVARTVVIRES